MTQGGECIPRLRRDLGSAASRAVMDAERRWGMLRWETAWARSASSDGADQVGDITISG